MGFHSLDHLMDKWQKDIIGAAIRGNRSDSIAAEDCARLAEMKTDPFAARQRHTSAESVKLMLEIFTKGAAVHFFIEGVTKIFALLALIIFLLALTISMLARQPRPRLQWAKDL